jgi:hypothetical protein
VVSDACSTSFADANAVLLTLSPSFNELTIPQP